MLDQTKSDSLEIRPAHVSDREAIIALITRVYLEHNEVICLEKYDSDLLQVPGHYRDQGGEFVVAMDGTQLIGTHAIEPIDATSGLYTFRRLYVDGAYRGSTNIGYRLMEWAIQQAELRNANRIEFWSDVRFTRAHQFFRRFGFVSTGEVRTIDDSFEPFDEFFFYLDLPR